MALPVPEQINHRRRVVYRSLIEVLQDDPRVAELFALLDGQVTKESQFLASKLVDEAVWMGLLRHEERIPLIRSLMRNMTLPYEQLSKYPSNLVAPTVKGEVSDELPPLPSLTQSPEQYLVQPTDSNGVAEVNLDQREAAPELLQYCAHRVFMYLTSRYIKGIQETRPVSLGRLLIYKALQTNQDTLVNKILQPWDRAKLNVRALPSDLSVEQMKSLVELLKLTATDIVGANVATDLLNKALNDAQKMPEASEFPPQLLVS